MTGAARELHPALPIRTLVTMEAEPILAAIRALGYHVSVFKMRAGISISGAKLPVPDWYVEMHAVTPGELDEVHIVRIDEGGAEAQYSCARELARMVIVATYHR